MATRSPCTAAGIIICSRSPRPVSSRSTALTEETSQQGRRRLPDAATQTSRRDLRRTAHPAGTLFRRDDVACYLANLDRALEQTTTELGPAGSLDVFDLTRRLGHRMGLASWAGPGSADGEAFERLVRAFDILDGSDAFVHPDSDGGGRGDGKARRARCAGRGRRCHRRGSAPLGAGRLQDDQGLFGRIVDAWTAEPEEDRLRGIALDIALIHIASMSNLAGRAWLGVGRPARAPYASGASRLPATPTSPSAARWSRRVWRNVRS